MRAVTKGAVFSAVLLTCCGSVLLLRKEPDHALSVIITSKKNRLEPSGQALKAAPGFDWSSLDSDDWQKLGEWFKGKTPVNGFMLNTAMMPGETIISSAYEGQHGELVLTQLTPFIRNHSDGKSYVEVEVLSYGVTTSGAQRTITHRKLELPARGGYTLMTPVPAPNGHGYSDNSYAVHISAQMDPATGNIGIKASGNFKDRSQPATRETKSDD
jgi:hypothetical protein